MKKFAIIALMSMVASVQAANVTINSGDITVSTTWTADNTYHLNGEVYVTGGATLTIEAGTRIEARTADDLGALIITRTGKIMALGTKDNPIVFTHEDDNDNEWKEFLNKWGNLTVCGEAVISASHEGAQPVTYQDGTGASVVTNTRIPAGLNKTQMEGLEASEAGDPRVLYGGNDDNDDSGEIMYVSIRYGGKNTAVPNKELNGLSLGGIGRETDIHHVEIMNNVDDGIEVWGGTVNLKYCVISNVGDDSFDFDQGWRGQAQFFCIVQGYSGDASQGSGVGDNAIEHDGSEAADAQPVTTASLYNFTVIGQPDGDGGTAWRDNARIQHRQHIFYEIGERLLRNDGDDGDGQLGYASGASTGHTLAHTFTTAYTTLPTWNAGSGLYAPSNLYQAHSAGDPSIGQGFLSEISDCLFYNNTYSDYDVAFLVTYSGSEANPTVEVTSTQLVLDADNVTDDAAFDLDSPASRDIQDIVDLINAETNWSATLVDADGTEDAADTLKEDGAVAPAGGFIPVRYLDPTAKTAYSEAISFGVLGDSGDGQNPVATGTKGNVVQADSDPSPFVSITRAAEVTRGGKKMKRVTYLDPRASSTEAKTAAAAEGKRAPLNGFFTPVPYRGAFSKDNNWLCGWTAWDEYGETASGDAGCASDPTVTGSVVAITSTTKWTDTAGVVYTVEKSYDLRNWIPVAVVVGDGGSDEEVSNHTTVEQGVIYRVIVQ